MQIVTERKTEIPKKVNLVLGHTHEPLQNRMSINGFPQKVDIYNSAGLVIDKLTQPTS